jgi:hypothetical protein
VSGLERKGKAAFALNSSKRKRELKPSPRWLKKLPGLTDTESRVKIEYKMEPRLPTQETLCVGRDQIEITV